MNNIIGFPKKRICDLYPPAMPSEIPEIYVMCPVDYRIDEINEYEIGLWHIFLKKYYGRPLENECLLCEAQQNVPIPNENGTDFLGIGTITFRYVSEKRIILLNTNEDIRNRYEAGEITLKPLGCLNWKYYIKISSQKICVLGTKNHSMFFALVDKQENGETGYENVVKKFIDLLLKEINKQKDNLIDFKKFKKSYLGNVLLNAYLMNYSTAVHFLQIAETEEQKLTNTLYKYDDETTLTDVHAKKHTQHYLCICGAYYSTSILYFFMSLEGFVNILFHIFQKDDFDDLNMERGLNIEQKIRFMPSLCEGFVKNTTEKTSHVLKEFRKFRDYRNKLFHSKIENSLKQINILADNFTYSFDMDKKTNPFSIKKIDLTIEDVYQAKKIVDDVISELIECMDEKTKKFVREVLLKEITIMTNYRRFPS